MSHLKKLFLLVAIFFLLVLPVRAFDFVKDSHNPLLITYTNSYAQPLQAHIFKKDNFYRGILTAKKPTENFYSLVLINSLDGINWQMEREILNTGIELSNARLFNNKLFMTRTDSDGKYRIYSTDCDDNLNCNQTLAPVLNIDSGDSTEQNGMFAGFPYQQDGRTYLFYGVWGIDGFKIRLGYSDDLSTWSKCSDKRNLVFGGDGPFAFKKDNDLYLFYHRSDSTGIKMAKTSLPLSCDSVFEDQGYQLTPNQWYDLRHLFFPSVVEESSGISLFYTGRGSDNVNRLNTAHYFLPTPTSTPTPTFTPTPTPTLTTTPTPTVNPREIPIVIIPGFMASWNREAILFNRSVPQSNWKMLSYVKEYDGLTKTLENLGYLKNQDYFVFNYDWRKPILETVNDLNSFITSNQSLETNFHIIGHSLGGLVGRFYQERYESEKLNKLITVGSPHQGVTQVYKVVEAGEIDRSNSYFWLAVKTVINLNKNKIETDRQTINRLFPVLKDVFPVYNFLKKDSVEIPILEMTVKNEVLSNESHKTNVISLAGEKGPTLKGFDVSEPSVMDKLLGNYPDGRPISSFDEIGDYLVLSESARLNNPIILNLDHGELIYKKEAIKRILELLEIPYSDSQVVEGKGTRLDQALVIFLKSKGKMQVEYGKNKYFDHDGIIIIEDAKQGNYKLKVKGEKTEKDEIYILRVEKYKESWEKIGKKNSQNHVNNYEIQY